MEKLDFKNYKPQKSTTYRWQELSLKYIKKFQIKTDKQKKVMFNLFKRNASKMETICSYVLEMNPRKPFAYILSEIKRRNST